jgi:hypothetical protein
MLVFYGSEVNGLVTSITQFISYFRLVEAGLAAAAVYALYKPLAEKNYESINSILSATNRFYMLSGCLFVILVLGLALFFPVFLETTELSTSDVRALVLILGVSGALDFFTLAKYRALLTADQKVYVISLASIVSTVINTTVVTALAYLGCDIVIVKFVALLSVFSRSLILCFYVCRNYPSIDYKAEPNHKALNKRWHALYQQILGAVQTGSPVIIATMFTSLQEVSVYAVFNMVMAGISGILSIFKSGIFASFGDLIARNEQVTLQKAYQEFEMAFYALISWIFSCTLILLMPFIKLYTSGITDVNYNLPVLGFLFVLNGLLYDLKTPQGMLVISGALYRETRKQVTIQALIILIGGVVFVQLWGLVGILVASILSNLYRTVDLLFYIPHKVTRLRVRDSFYRMVRVLICYAVVTFPFWRLIHIEAHSFLEWIGWSSVVAVYSLVVVLVINYVLDKNVFIRVFQRFKRMFGKDETL